MPHPQNFQGTNNVLLRCFLFPCCLLMENNSSLSHAVDWTGSAEVSPPRRSHSRSCRGAVLARPPPASQKPAPTAAKTDKRNFKSNRAVWPNEDSLEKSRGGSVLGRKVSKLTQSMPITGAAFFFKTIPITNVFPKKSEGKQRKKKKSKQSQKLKNMSSCASKIN